MTVLHRPGQEPEIFALSNPLGARARELPTNRLNTIKGSVSIIAKHFPAHFMGLRLILNMQPRGFELAYSSTSALGGEWQSFSISWKHNLILLGFNPWSVKILEAKRVVVVES